MIKLGGLVTLKPITEADVFTATSKETGTTSVFKSKDARDAAIKAGTHEKRKDDKDGAVKDPTDKPKVNIFNKDKEEPKSQSKGTFNLTDDFIDAIRVQYKNVKSHTPEQDKALEKSLIDKLDKEQLKKLADANVNVVSDMAAKKLKAEEEPKKERPDEAPKRPEDMYDEEHGLEDFREFGNLYSDDMTPEQKDEYDNLTADLEMANADLIDARDLSDQE